MPEDDLPNPASPYFIYQINGSEVGGAADSNAVPQNQTSPEEYIRTLRQQEESQRPQPPQDLVHDEANDGESGEDSHDTDDSVGAMRGTPIPGTNAEYAGDREADDEERISELERVAQNLKRDMWLPNPNQPIFFARFTSTAGAWQEQCYLGGAFVNFTGGRSGTSSVPASGALTPISAGQLVIMYEVLDPAIAADSFVWQSFDQSVLIGGLKPEIPDQGSDPSNIGIDAGFYGGSIVGGGVTMNTQTGSNTYPPPTGLGSISTCFVFNGMEGKEANGVIAHMIGGTGSPSAHWEIDGPQYGVHMGRIIGIVDSSDTMNGGVFIVMVSEFPAPAFPVYCTQDGGSDGSASGQATWTYTVQNQNKQILMMGATPLRPRPLGKMNYGRPPAEGPNGLAFIYMTMQGGVQWQYVLYDAGEVPNYTATTVVTGSSGTDFTTTTILTPNVGPTSTVPGISASDGSV